MTHEKMTDKQRSKLVRYLLEKSRKEKQAQPAKKT